MLQRNRLEPKSIDFPGRARRDRMRVLDRKTPQQGQRRTPRVHRAGRAARKTAAWSGWACVSTIAVGDSESNRSSQSARRSQSLPWLCRVESSRHYGGDAGVSADRSRLAFQERSSLRGRVPCATSDHGIGLSFADGSLAPSTSACCLPNQYVSALTCGTVLRVLGPLVRKAKWPGSGLMLHSLALIVPSSGLVANPLGRSIMWGLARHPLRISDYDREQHEASGDDVP